MAFPTMSEISGKHSGVYETYYKSVDPNFRGIIGAAEAAQFLKKSNLPNPILGKIWDMADRHKNGYLDKEGLFVALKLIALAQHHQEPSLDALLADVPAPKLASVADSPTVPMFTSNLQEWLIKPQEKAKYDEIFDSLSPENGKLRGDQVKPVLLNSGLPANVLGKIWQISDIDGDGCLDRDEMAVALHLVYRALENDPVPSELPRGLIPPSKQGTVPAPRRPSMAGAVPVLPAPERTGMRSRTSSVTSVDSLSFGGAGQMLGGSSRSLAGTPAPMSVKPPEPWLVDKARWEATFREADTNHDNLVNGADVKHILMASGLAPNYLAHIWTLCDIKQNGTLNLEQFALAMHLIEAKKQLNIEPPSSLTPDLVPPSFRPSPAGMTDMGTSTHETSGEPPAPTGNKEIDAGEKEVAELQRERRGLEGAVQQLEVDLTIKSAEIKNLDVEFHTLENTLGQLERQKGEAQKRLDDLDAQRGNMQSQLDDLRSKLDVERTEVTKLRMEIDQSSSSMKNQEEELNQKRIDLQRLRDEEAQLEVKVQMKRATLQQAERQNENMEAEMQHIQANIERLKEHNSMLRGKLQQLDDMLTSGDLSALESDTSLLDSSQLSLTLRARPHFTKSASASSGVAAPSHAHVSGSRSSSHFGNPHQQKLAQSFRPQFQPKHMEPFAAAPVGGFAQSSATVDDPFKSSDPFANVGINAGVAHDPFSAHDPFKDSGFDDPFKSSLDAFGGNVGAMDPFAASAGLPAPALPPKSQPQGKKAPPRPAPPKSRSNTPNRMEGDPFGGAADAFGKGSGGGFADFADFSKFS